MTRRPAIGGAVAGAVLFVVAAARIEAGAVEVVRVAVLGAALGALAITDLAERRIPNRIVIPASALCGALLIVGGTDPRRLLGSLALVAAMLVLSVLWPASFGMGDIKLAVLIALGLGSVATEGLALGLLLAAVFGALLLIRHGRAAAGRSLPLAPFLACGAALAVVVA